ncbi:MAG: O-antigen ligase family protein [Meiothermus sp.]|nr:O-antigen ligase family protein [Meiothermus sp.]
MRVSASLPASLLFPLWAWLAFPQILLYAYTFSLPLEGVFAIEGVFTLSKGLLGLFLLSLVFQIRRPKIAWLPALLLTWRQIPRLRISILAVVLMFWATASYFWSVDPSATWDKLQSLAQHLLGALAIALFIMARPKTLQPLLLSYSLGASIAAIQGISNYLRNPLSRTTFTGAADAADFAAIVLLGSLVAVGLWLSARSSWMRGYSLAVFIVCTLAVVLSGTRSAWVAILVTLALVILPRLGWQRLLPLSLVVFLAMLALYQLPAVNQFLTLRVTSAAEDGGAGRTAIWTVGWHIAQQNLFLGHGFGTFTSIFGLRVATESALESIDTYYITDGRGAHNIYLELVSEVGLVGLAIFLTWMWFLLRVSLRQAVHPDLILILKACLLAYLIQGAFLGILERKYLWLTIALLHGLSMMFRGVPYANTVLKP